jgi:hypothetical protein
MKKDARMQFPKSFGVFAPTGHILRAFPTDREAERARQSLVNNGGTNSTFGPIR